jgi:hypothetical protein
MCFIVYVMDALSIIILIGFNFEGYVWFAYVFV